MADAGVDPVLVERLVRETTDIVKPNLINVWIRAQGILAEHKREGTSLLPLPLGGGGQRSH